jgi:DNA-directed RNA polymerase beta' subunit
LRFSWDNQRLGEEIIIMARFDKVYIAKGLFENQVNKIAKGLFENQINKVAHYTIKGDKVRFNHHPTSCAMELMETPMKRYC